MTPAAALYAALDAALGADPPAALGAAVSGGSDSTALLLAAHRWSTAAGRSLAVATVDHGLRAEAAADR